MQCWALRMHTAMRAGKRADLLRTMFAHELQQEKGFVYMPPVFLSVLQASGKYTHDLFVIINVI